MPYKVSIVTSVLNGAATLPRCLASVTEQTYPCEHIVVDGGSSDGSRELVLGSGHAKLVDAPGSGISEAFNIGIEQAAGDIIGILNADDWYEPDAVARSVAALELHPQAGYSYGAVLIHRGERKILARPVPPEQFRAAFQRVLPFGHISSLVRRELYREYGGYDPQYRIAMDFDLYARMTARRVEGVCVEGVIGHVEYGGISASKRKSFGEYFRISSRYVGRPRALAYLVNSYARATLYNLANSGPLARRLFRRLPIAARFAELT